MKQPLVRIDGHTCEVTSISWYAGKVSNFNARYKGETIILFHPWTDREHWHDADGEPYTIEFIEKEDAHAENTK